MAEGKAEEEAEVEEEVGYKIPMVSGSESEEAKVAENSSVFLKATGCC